MTAIDRPDQPIDEPAEQHLDLPGADPGDGSGLDMPADDQQPLEDGEPPRGRPSAVPHPEDEPDSPA